MTGRRVAITGAGGQLGAELVRAFAAAGDEVLALARPDFDITRTRDLGRLTAWRPDVVVNSAAWTDVDACARDPERAMWINGEAAGAVAAAAGRAGALIVQISTNEVFDGTLARPYTEEDRPNPPNPYGASKLAGERLVADAHAPYLVIRTAWLFGPVGENFVTRILAAAHRCRIAGERLRVVADEMGNPTPTPWLAETIYRLAELALAGAAPTGIYHCAGSPATSRFGWAEHALRASGVELEAIPLAAYPRPSRPPLRALLALDRLRQLGLPPGEWHRATDALVARAIERTELAQRHRSTRRSH